MAKKVPDAHPATNDPDGVIGPACAGVDGERMSEYTILEAPSNLGLWPGGVERLPDALREAGLPAMLGADSAGRVNPPPYDSRRDPETHLLNGDAIRAYSVSLAGAVAPLIEQGRFPVVLGGDCSILLGAALALRRLGRYGLFFIDGHADFYQPEAEPRGEVASMELALVSGRGPAVLADIDDLGPWSGMRISWPSGSATKSRRQGRGARISGTHPSGPAALSRCARGASPGQRRRRSPGLSGTI